MKFVRVGAIVPTACAGCALVVVCAALSEARAGETTAMRATPWSGYEYVPAAVDAGVGDRQPPVYLGGSRGAASYGGSDWWTGFYAGGLVGYGLGTTRVHGDAGAFSSDQGGALLGALGGYNWSARGFVAGLEAEGKASWLSGDARVGAADLSQRLRWMGTVRARAGYLVAPALLVYGLAGVSAADVRLSGALLGGGTSEQIFLGLQVGGGAEMKLTEQWSLRVDYTYTNFGRDQIGPVGYSNGYDPSVHALQAAITYRF